jgi:hypothetical protein
MSAKILVCIACHNRRRIAELCLPTVKAGLEPQDTLSLWNDASTEYDDEFLKQWATESVRHTKTEDGDDILLPVGIQAQRRAHLKMFYYGERDWTHLIFTDHDCLHDPVFRSVALRIQDETCGAPICLYNTMAHVRLPNNTIEDNPSSHVIWRMFAPGCSYLLTAKHVEQIMAQIRYVQNFDWDIPRILGHRFAVSRVSYVDHIGAGGQHHDGSEGFDGGDRCLNPTPFLVEKRKEIVAALSKE